MVQTSMTLDEYFYSFTSRIPCTLDVAGDIFSNSAPCFVYQFCVREVNTRRPTVNGTQRWASTVIIYCINYLSKRIQ